MSFETNLALAVFKKHHSTLGDNLLKQHPIAPNKHTFDSVIQYYRDFIQTDAFHLTYTMEIDIEKILRRTNVSKAAGTGNLSGSFMKDGSLVL